MEILWCAYDRGGAQALMPVVLELRTEPALTVRGLAGSFALEAAQAHALEAISVSHETELALVTDMLRDPIALVLTASSSRAVPTIEQKVRNIAHAKGCRSVMLIDSWSDLPGRWNGASYALAGSGDWVCVVDDWCRHEIISHGVSPSQIVVVGQPYLEHLAVTARPPPAGLRSGKARILILTQSLTKAPCSSSDLLDKLLDRLRTVELDAITVRPHPTGDNLDEYERTIRTHSSSVCPISISPPGTNLTDLLNEHEVAIGFYTMGLFEAQLRGLRTFSLADVAIPAALAAAFAEAGISRVTIDQLCSTSISSHEAPSADFRMRWTGSTKAVLAVVRRALGELT